MKFYRWFKLNPAEKPGKDKTAAKSGVSAIDFFCIGFGAIVGVGWAVSINSWMISSGGPLPAAFGYLLAMVLMVPVSLCYCELCSMLPVSGGGMAYAFRAFGDNVAFVSGWAAFGAFITIIPWEAIYVVDILSILFPILKTGEPLYVLAGSGIYPGHIIVGTLISIALYFINRKGVSASASLQRVLCFALVGAGILAMICAGLKLDMANFAPVYENVSGAAHNSFMGGALAILASVPFFLAGFETIPQGIESAGGSKKSVGKTVVLTVVLSCLFYALLLATIGGAMPWQEFAHYDSPAAALLFRNIYPGAFGKALYTLILLGAFCGLITTWNGFMMASSQILMAMARVSIVPDVLAKQHPKYKTPIHALKVCLVASILGPFLGSGLIGSLTTFSAAGYVLSWTITAFCLIRLRKTEPELDRPYRIPGGLPMAWFAGISMAALLILLFIPGQPVYMGGFATALFGVWMLIGVALFILDYRQRQRYSKLKRASILFASMAVADIHMPGFTGAFEDDYRILSFVVPKDAKYIGETLMELGWGKSQNVFIIKIESSTGLIVLPPGRTTVDAGDRVFALGLEKSLKRFLSVNDTGEKHTITTMTDFMGLGKTERQAALSCQELQIEGNESFCGKAMKHSGIRERYGCMIIGYKRGDTTVMMPEMDTVIEKGDILWIMGTDQNVEDFIAAPPQPPEGVILP